MRLRRILYLRKTRRWFSCKASARLGMLQIRFGRRVFQFISGRRSCVRARMESRYES
jgi:hypothetical protein